MEITFTKHQTRNWEPNEQQELARWAKTIMRSNTASSQDVIWRKTWHSTTKQQFLQVRLYKIYFMLNETAMEQ